jgi:hypothetical protein
MGGDALGRRGPREEMAWRVCFVDWKRRKRATFSPRLACLVRSSSLFGYTRPLPSFHSQHIYTSHTPCHPSRCHEQRRCCVSLRAFLFLHIRLSLPFVLRHHSPRSTSRTTRAPCRPLHTCSFCLTHKYGRTRFFRHRPHLGRRRKCVYDS